LIGGVSGTDTSANGVTVLINGRHLLHQNTSHVNGVKQGEKGVHPHLYAGLRATAVAGKKYG
jgi:hypothetical protein